VDLEDFQLAETGDEPVKVYNLPDSEEAQAFEASFKFYEGSQHDHHRMRWDGTVCNEHDPYLRDRYFVHGLVPIDTGSASSRRPDLTTPTAATIVTRNTGLLFGSPVELDCIADEDTQELLRGIYKYGSLHLQFSEGRNVAGGGGNSIEVACVAGGKPVLKVYKPSEFRVLQWSDREQWQPARIVRQTLVPMQVRNRNGRLTTEHMWLTTEWTDREVIEYLPVPKGWDKDIPEAPGRRRPHGASKCPATWYKNTPSDSAWGLTDFVGLEPRCDVIDRLGSHLHSAVGNNCDATVFHLDEEGTRKRNRIAKRGRNQVWQGSEKGKFGLVEHDGKSLEVTEQYWRSLMHDTFELADVVRVTAETAGALKAAEAIRLLWRASEVRVGRLWPQREETMRRGMEAFYEMAKTFGVSSIEAPKERTMILPSRVVPVEAPEPPAPPPPKPPAAGEHAEPDGDEAPALPVAPIARKPPPERPKVKLQPHKVGKFGFIALKPGPYFQQTAAEKNAAVTTIAAAESAKLLSHETAVTQTARAFEVDPHEEQRRLHEEGEANDAKAMDMMSPMSAAGLKDADKEREEDDEDEAARGDDKTKAKPASEEDEDESE